MLAAEPCRFSARCVNSHMMFNRLLVNVLTRLSCRDLTLNEAGLSKHTLPCWRKATLHQTLQTTRNLHRFISSTAQCTTT